MSEDPIEEAAEAQPVEVQAEPAQTEDVLEDRSPEAAAEAELAADAELAQLVDARVGQLQEASQSRRRRMELIKFGVLAVIMLGAVFIIGLSGPLLFGKVVPAVMEGADADAGETDGDSGATTGEDGSDADDTAAGTTQNLPIVSSPDEEGASAGGEETEGENGADEGGSEDGAEEADSASETGDGSSADVPAQTYVVQPGDTLNSIARQFNTTVEAIAAANNIPNPDNVVVGTTLTVPQAAP